MGIRKLYMTTVYKEGSRSLYSFGSMELELFGAFAKNLLNAGSTKGGIETRRIA